MHNNKESVDVLYYENTINSSCNQYGINFSLGADFILLNTRDTANKLITNSLFEKAMKYAEFIHEGTTTRLSISNIDISKEQLQIIPTITTLKALHFSNFTINGSYNDIKKLTELESFILSRVKCHKQL